MLHPLCTSKKCAIANVYPFASKMGERADSLTQIRECVKLDDNHKECFDFYKMLKKFNKLMDKVDENVAQGRFAEALQNTDKVRKLGITEPVYARRLAVVDCQSNVELKRTAQAAEVRQCRGGEE